MSIREYFENNQTQYAVNICIRSKQNRELRIQRFQSGVKSLKEAERVERKLRSEAYDQLKNKELGSREWRCLIDEWELALRAGTGSLRLISKETQEDYVNVLRNFTSEWWRRSSDSISAADVREVLIVLHETGKSQARQFRFKTAIDGIFKWGIETRKIKGVYQSPARGVSVIGRIEEKKPEILNLSEIRTLLKSAQAMNHPWFPVWSMALLTGCRAGELFCLEWTDIDFDNKRISISKSFNKRTRATGPTKGRYWREVPISSELERFLKELKLKHGNERWVLRHHSEWATYQQAAVLRAFCVEIGLPSVKFHTLRSCFATQLIKDGVAPAIIMKICGWKTLKTMQIYIRLAGIEIEGATETLKIMPEEQVMARVVDLFDPNRADKLTLD